jgi:hypothetical protein
VTRTARRVTVVVLLAAASGRALADPREYGSLSAAEQASCDEYATQAERFARGREAGFSIMSPLKASRDACAEHPDSDKACKGFPDLARTVHREKWTTADAAKNVRSDCLRWIYP